MRYKSYYTIYVFLLLLIGLVSPPFTQANKTQPAGECKEHVELHSVAYLANEYGKSETWVLSNVKIGIWERPSDQGKGKKIGQLLPGSRAVILATSNKDYKVQSPLDKSIGWLSKIQVTKRLFPEHGNQATMYRIPGIFSRPHEQRSKFTKEI